MTNTRIGHMLTAARKQATPERLRSLPDRLVGWRLLPPLLLLAALSTVFIFANDRGTFYRPGHHSNSSMFTLSIATNLSPEHNFALYHQENITGYQPYSRFPIGSYALVKLAILPFRPDISNQIHSARVLMLFFFIGSGLLAYLALSKIFQNRWACLASTALAFSSFYILRYSDMISPEYMTNLFGIFLTLHGMAIFIQDGKFRQLLGKTCIAILFGWHIYALLIPFVTFGVFRSAMHWVKQENKEWNFRSIIRNPFLIIGMVALVFGGILLSFNIINEFILLENVSLGNLPTIQSFIYRSGFNQEWSAQYSDTLKIYPFTIDQIYRIGGMMLPFGIPGFTSGLGSSPETDLETHRRMLGAVSLVLILFFLARTRHKIVLFPLATMGFFWSFPFRNQSAFHDAESIFYIGIPLIIISIIFLAFNRISNERPMFIISLTTLLILCLSIAQMGSIGISAVESGRQKALFTDIENIQSVVKGEVLYIPDIDTNDQVYGFYFPGSIISQDRSTAEYAISRENLPGRVSLIPNATSLFLYTAEEYNIGYDDAVAQIESTILRLSAKTPDIDEDATGYDVYHDGNSLWYLQKGECGAGPTERDATFFLHVVPLNVNDLPANRREFGFDGLDFLPAEHWLEAGGYCVIERRLPQYEIASIRTGQYDASGELWSGEIRIAELE